jgi:molybdopterin-guanine dinucleotide biosynthesis protein A
MGSDKALLLQDGQSQLDRTVDLLDQHVSRVFVSARPDQKDDPVRAKFEQIVDQYEDMGPVAGILSAMDANKDVSWLVIACDLPNVDSATISYLLENVSMEHHATAYRSNHDDLPEPLCAVYRPHARPVIDSFVAQGMICPRKMLIKSATHLLNQPNPDALHNINSPADLAGTGVEYQQ